MRLYRYRTCVLVGPWRDAHERAVADAVRAKQARTDGTGDGLVWLVPGRIEVAEGAEEPLRHRD